MKFVPSLAADSVTALQFTDKKRKTAKISPSQADDMMMAAAEVQPTKKKRRASMCVGCGGQITDQYILRVAPDLEWHASCLKCTDCSVYLDETCTCFVRDGKTYCKRDYVRLFGTKCSRCSQGFAKTDFVMRAKNKIYHINCFRCVACSRELIPGDEFALREDGLFCKADHDIVESSSVGSRSPSGGHSDDSKQNILNNNNNDTKNGMHSVTEGSPHGSGTSGGSGSVATGRSGRHKSEQKTTRVRTVLNEKQLHTLRTCYSANPRPDALMKEQLVEMTALSPRVIRVWFQNKRCKDKKKSILMKQIQQQQQDKGVPMVASSPVRHEGPPNMQPASVEQYQAPWKALTEFAMQSDLDQPPFQQLMHSFDLPPECRDPMAQMYGPPHHLGAHLPIVDEHLFHRPRSAASDNSLIATDSDVSSPMSS